MSSSGDKHPERNPRASTYRQVNLVIGYLYLSIGMIALFTRATPAIAALFFIPFALGSHFAHLVIAHRALTKLAQVLTGIAMLAYMTWATFVYVSAFHLHLDAQSAIALLFITPYSLPVLVPIWLWIAHVERRNRRKIAGAPAPAPQ